MSVSFSVSFIQCRYIYILAPKSCHCDDNEYLYRFFLFLFIFPLRIVLCFNQKQNFLFYFQEPSGTLKDKAKINSDYRFKICPSFTGWFGGQMRIQQSGCPVVLAQ